MPVHAFLGLTELEQRLLLADTVGARVLSHTPTTVAAGGGPLSAITLTFNEAIDPLTFAAEDVVLDDPLGQAIAGVLVNAVGGSGDTQFVLSFSPQTLRGTYRMTVGPNVLDLAGNAMNQDNDATNGEATVDTYRSATTFAATPLAVGAGPDLYLEGFETWPPKPDHWEFEALNSNDPLNSTTIGEATTAPRTGTRHFSINRVSTSTNANESGAFVVDLSSVSAVDPIFLEFYARRVADGSQLAPLTVVMRDPGFSISQIARPNLSVAGYHRVVVDVRAKAAAAGINLNGPVFFHFRDSSFSALNNIAVDDIRLTTADLGGPRVLSVSPTTVAAAQRPLTSFQVTFSEAIAVASFTAADVTLFSPAGDALVIADPVDSGDGKTWTIPLVVPLNQPGEMRLAIGINVTDLAGNIMNQDSDENLGETNGDDDFEGKITLAATPFAGPFPFTEGFEAGTIGGLGAYWGFITPVDGHVRVVGGPPAPAAGSFNLSLDGPSGNGSASQSQIAVLHLDLVGRTGVTLEFEAASTGFFRRNVSVRTSDSAAWQIIDGLTNLGATQRLDLDAEIAALGIAYTNDFQIGWTFVPASEELRIDSVLVRTDGADVVGPRVTSAATQTHAASNPLLSEINITFNDAIDPASFTAADIVLTSSLGTAIPVGTVTPIAGTNNTQFTIAFASQSVRGNYRYTVGPNINDDSGNPMNQDDDGLSGEATGTDDFDGAVDYQATPVVLPASGAELYTERFEGWPPVPAEWYFNPTPPGVFKIPANEAPNNAHSFEKQLQFDSNTSGDVQIVRLYFDAAALAGATDLTLEFFARQEKALTSGSFAVNLKNATRTKSLFFGVLTTTYQKFTFDLDAQLASGLIDISQPFFVEMRQDLRFESDPDTLIDDVRIFRSGSSLTLTPAATLISEGGGPAATTMTVTRTMADLSADLLVSLTSSDTSELTLPPTVTILANQTSVTFDVAAVNDALIDGRERVTVTASAAGLAGDLVPIDVDDDEPAALVVTIDRDTISEADGLSAATVTVMRNSGYATALTVTLASNDITEANPAVSTLIIPAGAESATFNLNAASDAELDGTQTVTITASAAGFPSGSDTVDVLDDDTALIKTLGGVVFGSLPAGEFVGLYDMIIPLGQTLTIAPGSVLRFNDDAGVTVFGVLTADGDAANPITFTSSAATPAPGDWDGIRVLHVGGLRTLLDHTEIAYARTGLSVEVNLNGTVAATISNSQVHHHLSHGIFVEGDGQSITAANMVIDGNSIHDNGSAGIAVQAFAFSESGGGASVSATITGNDIFANATGLLLIAGYAFTPLEPATGASTTPTVTGNHIHHNGVGVDGAASASSDAVGTAVVGGTYTNNLIVLNSGAGLTFISDDESSATPTLVNNTVANNGGAGLVLDSAATTVRNNLIAGNQVGITAPSGYVPSNPNLIGFNNVFGNAGGNLVNLPAEYGNLTTVNANGTPADAQMNIGLDPLFVGAGNFHLQLTSPLIDAGTVTGAPTTDFDGDTRITPPDIGFDEVNPLTFVPPVVTQVFLGSTAWSTAFRSHLQATGIGSVNGYAIPAGTDQHKTLPWVNLDQVTIVFSEHVGVAQSDLIVGGVNVTDYTIGGFAYDSDTFTATWTLAASIGIDKLLITLAETIEDDAGNALDGDWSNGADAFPSGNGIAGGEFSFRFNVLPGDVDQGNSVLGNDVILVRNAQFQTPGGAGYSAMLDVNGSGLILGNGVILVRNRQFTSLPGSEPATTVGAATEATLEFVSAEVLGALVADFMMKDAADDSEVARSGWPSHSLTGSRGPISQKVRPSMPRPQMDDPNGLQEWLDQFVFVQRRGWRKY